MDSQSTRFDSVKNCGMKHVLQVAFPLIMAAAGHAVNLFSDRVMLARYSAEAVSAAMPAGMTSFSISCIFVGIVGYANTFVAQYTGAGAEKRVGVSIWQAAGVAAAMASEQGICSSELDGVEVRKRLVSMGAWL